MTAWTELGPADFDASKADKRAARAARQAAESGQAGLFFMPTPARADKPGPASERLPGEVPLFGDDNESERI